MILFLGLKIIHRLGLFKPSALYQSSVEVTDFTGRRGAESLQKAVFQRFHGVGAVFKSNFPSCRRLWFPRSALGVVFSSRGGLGRISNHSAKQAFKKWIEISRVTIEGCFAAGFLSVFAPEHVHADFWERNGDFLWWMVTVASVDPRRYQISGGTAFTIRALFCHVYRRRAAWLNVTF